jgi:hypothetical protein
MRLRGKSSCIPRLSRAGLCMALVVMATTTLGAASLDRYREHVLGSTVVEVLARAEARATDVVTLHERPVPVQQLEWRPPYSSARRADDDPVEAVRFAFVDGRLYELTITYVQGRTKGMTAAELLDGVAAIYGPPNQADPPAAAAKAATPRAVVLGRWQDPGASLTLVQGPYGDVELTIRSEPLGAQAREAIRAAEVLEAAEAPGRTRQADADAQAAIAAERARNRSGFRP